MRPSEDGAGAHRGSIPARKWLPSQNGFVDERQRTHRGVGAEQPDSLVAGT